MAINVLLVFGTRPEAIKMAPVYNALKANTDIFNASVCVTGQHREMLDQVLDIFDIVPHADLNVMKHGQDLFDVTKSILSGMRDVFFKFRPDVVLVHGDTTTTLATSLAAFYAKIPVGHIEAGLRTNNIHLPFPEELNRQVTSKLTKWHFSPTELARNNLINEGFPKDSIVVTGNTVIDSLHWVLKRIENNVNLHERFTQLLSAQLQFPWKESRYILITGHRRENFGQGFKNICEALVELSKKFSETHFVYPVHLNPNVQNSVNSMLAKRRNLHLIEPLEYEPFIYLLKHCHFVLTDSGGLQEEAPSLGKPVLVMRHVTERPEAIESGTIKLVGTDKQIIVNEVSALLQDLDYYTTMARAHNPYGDGNASVRILNSLMESFNEKI